MIWHRILAWWRWVTTPHYVGELSARLAAIEQQLGIASWPSPIPAAPIRLYCGHSSASYAHLRNGTKICHDCHQGFLRIEREVAAEVEPINDILGSTE